MKLKRIPEPIWENKGSVSLESALVLPAIFFCLLTIILLINFISSKFFNIEALISALNETSFTWSAEETDLYWNVLTDNKSSRETKGKLEKARENFYKNTAFTGTFTEVNFEFQKSILTRKLWGRLDAKQKDGISAAYSLSIREKIVLPAENLRNKELIKKNVLPIINEGIEKLLGLDRQDKGDEDKNIVYIRDSTEKEHNYLKVYHLSENCRYLQGGDYMAVEKWQAAFWGFRPCLICLEKNLP